MVPLRALLGVETRLVPQGITRYNGFRAVTINGQCLAELQQSGFRVVGEEGRETLLAR